VGARLIVLTAAGALALGVSAAAAQTPVWVEAPTYADAAAVYPAKARAAHIGGNAVMTCSVTLNGRLSDCASIGSSPDGMGFDDAAHRLTPKLKAQLANGVRPGSEVRFTIGFTPDMIDAKPGLQNNITWAALPAISDFQASFPKSENGVNHVRVVMDCGVQKGGVLSDCAVESEDPAGQGYGAGALALTPKIRVGLLTGEGVPTVGARVRVPIRYELTPQAQALTDAKPKS
jgi:TonB family protein